jgi:hypothetical protein
MATYPGSDRVIRMDNTTTQTDETTTQEAFASDAHGWTPEVAMEYAEWLADVERRRDAELDAEAEWAEMMVRQMEGR